MTDVSGDSTDRDTPEVRREIPESAAPSTTVVRAVAEARDDPPTDLPALLGAIDPDALDALVRQASTDDTVVGFDFAGHEVEVTGDGVVRVLA
jgi:hypothetical protein